MTLFDFSTQNFTSDLVPADDDHLTPRPTDVASSTSTRPAFSSSPGPAHSDSHCAPGDLYATVTEHDVSNDEVVTSSEICRSSLRRSVVYTSQGNVISIVLHVDQSQRSTGRDVTRSKFILMYEGMYSGIFFLLNYPPLQLSADGSQ